MTSRLYLWAHAVQPIRGTRGYRHCQIGQSHDRARVPQAVQINMQMEGNLKLSACRPLKHFFFVDFSQMILQEFKYTKLTETWRLSR